MVNPYKESGWLPEWSSPGHRDCMIGSNSASIISEAYLKGITNFDIGIPSKISFEKGIKLARQCQEQLSKAELQVQKLIEENGELKTAPLKDD